MQRRAFKANHTFHRALQAGAFYKPGLINIGQMFAGARKQHSWGKGQNFVSMGRAQAGVKTLREQQTSRRGLQLIARLKLGGAAPTRRRLAPHSRHVCNVLHPPAAASAVR